MSEENGGGGDALTPAEVRKMKLCTSAKVETIRTMPDPHAVSNTTAAFDRERPRASRMRRRTYEGTRPIAPLKVT